MNFPNPMDLDPLLFLKKFENVEIQPQFGLKPQVFSLEPIKQLLKRQTYQKGSTKFIHIAGSKGKGSFAHFLEAFFLENQHSVGTFTSPHLFSLQERIRWNGEPITLNALRQELQKLNVFPEEPFSLFEILTALALYFFSRQSAQWGIFEVGLGGRVDATNILDSDLCVLTEITLEHQKILGETYEAIAREKLGILKPGVPLLSLATQPEAKILAKELTRQLSCPLIQYGEHFAVEIIRQQSQEVKFRCIFEEREIEMTSPYSAVHQARYLAGAWVAQQLLKQNLRPPSVAKLKLAGREEWQRGTPTHLYDVAHEPLSLIALENLILSIREKYQSIFLLFGCLEDKQIFSALQKFAQWVDFLYLTRLDHPRSWSPIPFFKQQEETIQSKIHLFENLRTACIHLEQKAQANDLLVFTGSFTVVQQAQQYFLKKP